MSQSYFDSFLDKVKQGRSGDMVWIPSPYDRLKDKIGISKKQYTLLGGDPGTGKSAFIDTTYILHIFSWYMANKDRVSFKPKIILRSMERSKEYRIAKWVCQLMFRKFNILIDVRTIFGMHSGDSVIDKEIMKKIKQCRKFVDKMEDYITVIDGRTNPTGAYAEFRHYALKNGTLYKKDKYGDLKKCIYRVDKRQKVGWEEISIHQYPNDYRPPEQYEQKYIPDDENEIVVPIVDHIGEYRSEEGLTGKALLDRAGERTVTLRDLYGMSPIDVAQFNRNLSDTRRRTGRGIDLQPEEQDFMGSSTMYQRLFT